MTYIDVDKLLAEKGLKDLRLDIGAGGYSSDSNFLSVDAFTEADIKALMWDIPLPDESVDFIWCSQALEHLSKFEVVPTLREWWRILKIGGKAQATVPDLEWSCWWWLTHQTVEWDLDIIYGNQKHQGEFHKTGFTPRILKMYIDICGGFDIHKIYYSGGEVTNLRLPENYQSVGGASVDGRIINVELLKVARE